MTGDPTWLLWAKRGRGENTDGGPSYHPLVCHLIDVAMVAAALWPVALPSAIRHRLTAALGLNDEDTARRWTALFTGLSDIGKAAPGFACKLEDMEKLIRRAGYDVPGKDPTPHGIVSAKAMIRLAVDLGMQEVALPVARVIGGHHGTFPTGSELSRVGPTALGGVMWEKARRQIALQLKSVCGLEDRPAPRRSLAREPWLLMVLAGLTTVADWIASDENYFPYSPIGVDLTQYADRAAVQASRALAELGWSSWHARPEALSFHRLFSYAPNALQATVAGHTDRLTPPALALLEYPMGGGKTEAAMYVADRSGLLHGHRGIYFALPTEATSNQMFRRIKRFLSRRYPAEVVNLQLLHGHAALSAEFEAARRHADRLLRPGGIDGLPGYDGAPAGVVAAEWFTRRKRGLLAPFGVGTVDQVLLAVLQTRHYFVRLFGLAGKTVIIDEVHAYDAYMSVLLERLLEWIAHLGCTVVLLSATLPAQRRRALVEAFARGLGHTPAGLEADLPYPRLTLYTAEGEWVEAIAPPPGREVAVDWVDGRLRAGEDEPYPLGERLRSALASGGCAAVICNSVATAQQVFRALQRYFPPAELDLFHARYRFEERDRRERRTLQRFGKPAAGVKRPHRCVLVATQVIEQSLDIDFDLMVTELAPVDLVLQRLGRLHRHERPRLLPPALWIVTPEVDSQGVPLFNRSVYAPHVLLRSWLALEKRTAISLPGDVTALIEAVYSASDPPEGLSAGLLAAWERSRRELEAHREGQKVKADARLVVAPDPEKDLLAQRNDQLEEEDPAVHTTIQALTRDGEPSVPVVLLCEEDGAVDPAAVPDREQTLRLLARSVRLSHGGLVAALLKEPAPPGWVRSPWLRHHRLLVLDHRGCTQVGEWRLELDPYLGVLITKGGRVLE